MAQTSFPFFERVIVLACAECRAQELAAFEQESTFGSTRYCCASHQVGFDESGFAASAVTSINSASYRVCSSVLRFGVVHHRSVCVSGIVFQHRHDVRRDRRRCPISCAVVPAPRRYFFDIFALIDTAIIAGSVPRPKRPQVNLRVRTEE